MDLTEFASNPLVSLLAFAGGAALVYRLVLALLRVGVRAAEGTAINGLMEISMRNGDLTGMAERRAMKDAIRRARGRDLLSTGLWGALLVAPAIAGVASLVYAPAALVWLLPRKRVRLLMEQAPRERTPPHPAPPGD
jgi:hypothetical protein